MFVFQIIFLGCLGIHAYTDLRFRLLYNRVSAVLFISGLVFSYQQGQLVEALSGASICGGIMLLLYFASKGGMGEGDVKFAPALGAWLGVEGGLLCLLAAFVLGGAVGILLLLSGICRRGEPIPFGPFLCIGAIIAFYWGKELVQWYLGKMLLL